VKVAYASNAASSRTPRRSSATTITTILDMRTPSDVQHILPQVSDVNPSPASHEGPEFLADIWLVIARNLAWMTSSLYAP
jgi:hypothetical protein